MRKYTRTEIKLLQTEHVCIDDRFFMLVVIIHVFVFPHQCVFFFSALPMTFAFNTFDYYEWNDRKQIESQIFQLLLWNDERNISCSLAYSLSIMISTSTAWNVRAQFY